MVTVISTTHHQIQQQPPPPPPPPPQKKKKTKQGSKKLGHVHSLLEPGPTKIYFVQILIIVIHKWGICNSNKMGITFWKNNQD
jgi:hypothetical protein